jgi:hypothetical protein
VGKILSWILTCTLVKEILARQSTYLLRLLSDEQGEVEVVKAKRCVVELVDISKEADMLRSFVCEGVLGCWFWSIYELPIDWETLTLQSANHLKSSFESRGHLRDMRCYDVLQMFIFVLLLF